MGKGKLVNVKISPGRFVKMYEADAIAKGLIPGAKAKPQAENKMLSPAKNKALEEAPPEEKLQADEFTSITGVGPATARALVSHGIITFAQLREPGDLAYLTAKTREAINVWRASG